MNQTPTQSNATVAAAGASVHGLRKDRAQGNGANRSVQRASQPAASQLNEIATFHAELKQLEKDSQHFDSLVVRSLQLVADRAGSAGAFLVRSGIQSSPDQPNLEIASCAIPATPERLKHIEQDFLKDAAESLAKNRPVVATFEPWGMEFIAIPAAIPGQVAIVSVLNHPVSQPQRSVELSLLHALDSFLLSASQRLRMQTLSLQSQRTAAALELIQWIQDAQTLDQGCLTVVSQMKQYLHCDRVFLGMVSGGTTCRLRAVSDMPQVDVDSQESLSMAAVLNEAIGRESSGSWPPLPGMSPHRLLAHKQLAQKESLVASVPLKNRDGQVVAALGIIGSRELVSTPDLGGILNALSEPIGETLDLVRRNQKPAITRIARAALGNRFRARQCVIAMSLIAMGIILAMPWPYTIGCDSVAEPVSRRFCVAPQDGILQTALARPGDVVQSGQPLAKMDGREIRWELAGVTADEQRAAAQRDQYLANQQTPEAVMADLEFRTLRNKHNLLKYRESSLQVNSPISGVVLSGSLDRRDNAPVSKGQVLFEVAPLDRLRIEVSIPAREIAHVEIGDPAEIYFEGIGETGVTGTIESIQPRSQVRDGDNVFVAEIEIENTDQLLRPGMQAITNIKTREQRVAWILFHHAAEKVIAWW